MILTKPKACGIQIYEKQMFCACCMSCVSLSTVFTVMCVRLFPSMRDHWRQVIRKQKSVAHFGSICSYFILTFRPVGLSVQHFFFSSWSLLPVISTSRVSWYVIPFCYNHWRQIHCILSTERNAVAKATWFKVVILGKPPKLFPPAIATQYILVNDALKIDHALAQFVQYYWL